MLIQEEQTLFSALGVVLCFRKESEDWKVWGNTVVPLTSAASKKNQWSSF